MAKLPARRRNPRSKLPQHAVLNKPAENDELVLDFARYKEGIMSRKEIVGKHRLSPADLEHLGKDDAFVYAILLREIQRRHDGSSKREKAQLHATKIPDRLDEIASDPNAGWRAKIEASKLQNSIADGPAANGGQATSEKFSIVINLGADTEKYEKDIAPIKPAIDLEAASEG